MCAEPPGPAITCDMAFEQSLEWASGDHSLTVPGKNGGFGAERVDTSTRVNDILMIFDPMVRFSRCTTRPD